MIGCGHVVVPTAREEANIQWRYTTQQPDVNWFKPDFNDASWTQGPAGFGTKGTPGAVVRTEWKTADIWLRREFSFPADVNASKLFLQMHHDEDAEVYINGVRAGTASGFISDYEDTEMSPAAQKSLTPGKNILAVHCHQTAGGQYIDVGIATAK